MEEIFRESWHGRARFPPQNSANKKKLIWFWKDGWIWRIFLGWNWMKLVFSPKVETPSITPPGKICVLGWTSFLKLQQLVSWNCNIYYTFTCTGVHNQWTFEDSARFSLLWNIGGSLWRDNLESLLSHGLFALSWITKKTWIFEDDGDKHHPIIYLWWSQIHSDWFCIWLWAQLLYLTFSDPPPKKKNMVKGDGDAVTYVPDLKSYFLTKIPPNNPQTAAPKLSQDQS